MSFYERKVLPHLIRIACGSSRIAAQRALVVPRAQGQVLEIGIGGGLNLAHYDKARVTRLYGLEPSAELLDMARHEGQRAGMDFEPLMAGAEAIPLENHSVDDVVVTYTMCSIPDLPGALAEIRRVLRPGGALHFCEHTAAPDAAVARMQHRLTPFWRRVGGGCHLDRDTPAILRENGFDTPELHQAYLPKTWRVVGFNSWGRATAR